MFVALALIEVAWVFGVPLGAAPDEPAHVYRAVALVRGDVIPAKEVPPRSGMFLLTLPGPTVDAVAPAKCTAFRPAVSNRCAAKAPRVGPGTTQAQSSAARYLPLYYAVVGWPSLIDPGRHGVFGMRLVSGLVCAVMLAGALATLTRMRRPVLPVIGGVAAVTPMVTGLAGTVNPNAWEISGCVLLWAALLGLASGQVTESRRSLLAKVAVAGTVVLLTRQISMIWVGLIVVTVVAAGGPRAVRAALGALRRSRAVQGVVALLVVAAAGEQYWYTTLAKTFQATSDRHNSFGYAVMRSALHVPNWLSQTWGVLGWLDTPLPLLGLVVWVAVLGLLLMLVVLGTRGPLRFVVVGVPVIAVVVSVLLEALFWNALNGYWWQGRYVMPYALGLPLLSGVVGATVWRLDARAARLLLRWTVVPLTLLSCLGYYAVGHRYGIGALGTWLPSRWPWHPPGGFALLAACYALGALVVAQCLIRAADPARGQASGRGSGSGAVSDDGELPPGAVLVRATDGAPRWLGRHA